MPPGVEVKNLDKVRADFAGAEKEIEAALDAELQPLMDAMRKQLQAYPATRPRQKYQRTGTLASGWDAGFSYVVGKGGVNARLSNSVRYTPYVQTDARQAWFHRGRWINTVEHVQQVFTNDMARALQRAADTVAKELG